MCLSGAKPPAPSKPTFSGPITCTKGCPDNPPYEPGKWNTSPYQTSTNCYAYAANDRLGHPKGGKPQPGVKCGKPFSAVSCASVGAASACDGMIPAPNPPPPKPGYYPVALVMHPGVDYHWYRLDNTGTWSHKPGHGPATNLDASGNPITNPETANRDYGRVNYKEFCGYYYVPAAGSRTAP